VQRDCRAPRLRAPNRRTGGILLRFSGGRTRPIPNTLRRERHEGHHRGIDDTRSAPAVPRASQKRRGGQKYTAGQAPGSPSIIAPMPTLGIPAPVISVEHDVGAVVQPLHCRRAEDQCGWGGGARPPTKIQDRAVVRKRPARNEARGGARPDDGCPAIIHPRARPNW